MASLPLKVKGLSKSSRYRIRRAARNLNLSLIQNRPALVNNSSYFTPNNLNNNDYACSPNCNLIPNQFNSTSKKVSTDNFLDLDYSLNITEEEVLPITNVNSLPSLEDFLASWDLKFHIKHEPLSELLKGLRNYGHPDLCRCAKTLLHTPKTTIIRPLCGGNYHHIGIETELIYLTKQNIQIPDVININIGIDGLPISESTTDELWPILGLFTNILNPRVFLIGVYHGKTKPKDANEYLSDFIFDITKLITVGFKVGERVIKVNFQSLIADAPAKAFLLNVKYHTGKDSCTKCHTKGFWAGKVSFPIVISRLRSHDSFLHYNDQYYHNGPTKLVSIPNFSLVEDVVIDYMHLVLEGVVQKIIGYWINGRHSTKLPSGLIQEINERLLKCAQYIPNEFQRVQSLNSRAHPFNQASRWKATESRQFLLYTCILCLDNIVSNEIKYHFYFLVTAMRILLSPTLCKNQNDYANQLLGFFVAEFGRIYGMENVSYNVHGILHLAGEGKKFGPLDLCSAFPFESYMQILKKDIRSLLNPLQQIARRYMERKINVINLNDIEQPLKCIGQIMENGGIMVNDAIYPQYIAIKINTIELQLYIKLNRQDRYVKTKCNTFVEVETIATSKTSGGIVLVGRQFENLSDWFTTPCRSSYIDIYYSTGTGSLMSWKIEDICGKFICFPAHIVGKSGFILNTLVHHI